LFAYDQHNELTSDVEWGDCEHVSTAVTSRTYLTGSTTMCTQHWGSWRCAHDAVIYQFVTLRKIVTGLDQLGEY
jgi:hypothetical protein